jgi:hypothetical protein
MSDTKRDEERQAREAQQKRDEERARTMAGQTKPAAEQQSADAIMEIRKQAGSIAEVIEPVTRTRLERTDR